MSHGANYILQYDIDRGYMVPRVSAISSDLVQDAAESGTDSDNFSSQSQMETRDDLNQTASITQEDENPPLQNCKKLKHQDPLDDSIFTKRLGKSLVGLACIY